MEKNNLLGLVAIVGLIAVVLVLAVDKQDTQESMSVSGNAEMTVTPDEAIAYLSIVTDAETAQEAQAENNDLTADVIAALKAAGIAEKDIETSSYNLHKKYEWNPVDMRSEEQGYELIHTLKVTTKDISNVGKYVDAAITAGANGVDRIDFTLTRELEKQVKEQALGMAIAAARSKAENIAEATGVKLGKVITIQESNFYYAPAVYNSRDMMEKAMDAGAMISPQKVDVSSSIQIVYSIA